MRGLFSIFLFCICNGALAQHNPRPRLIPIGCNFDGGLAWLALGKAAAGPELESFQVEISDVDLESVEATISPSKMDMFMPYGLGPVVGPINVASASISPRNIDGVLNGKCSHHPLQYFVFLFHPDRVFATWLNLVHSRAKQ